MADTIRNQSDLLALFPDNNQGSITAQSIRDLVVSSARGNLSNLTDQATARINLRLRPSRAPYHIDTRPFYLDWFWSLYKARGYSSSQSATSQSTLSVAAADGAVTLTVNDGSIFAVGEPICLVSGYVVQTFMVNSISGNVLTVFPKVYNSGAGFAIGTPVAHLWSNSTHSSNTAPAQAIGYWIANAKRRGVGGGMNLLGTVGDMTTSYTDVNSIANVPTGWVSVTPASIGSFIVSNYGPSQNSPNARTGNGAYFSVSSSGAGLKTNTAIPVQAGQVYTLSAMTKLSSGVGTSMSVLDFDTGTTIATLANANGLPVTDNYANMGTPAILTFAIPAGTKNLQIQFLSGSATDQVYIDDVRLIAARQDAADNRYVIEDPGDSPIVVLGDSWAVASFSYFQTALNARIGRTLNIINAGVSGNSFTQQLARFVTDVTPYNPAYVIHFSGFINDLVQNRTTVAIKTDLLSFIAACRNIGAIPVIAGVAPCNDVAITGTLQTSHDLNDAMRAACDAILL